MKYLIIGDVHGRFDKLANIINATTNYDIALQVGDMGIFPTYLEKYSDILNNMKKRVNFVDGNHEHFNYLEDYSNFILNTYHLNHMTRGTIKRIYDKYILFIGGAESIDSNLRIPGDTIFPEESISQLDFNKISKKLETHNSRIDIVISHTCPDFIDIGNNDIYKSPSRTALTQIYNIVQPKLWFFGHFHKYYETQYNNTKFYGLDRLNGNDTSHLIYNI